MQDSFAAVQDRRVSNLSDEDRRIAERRRPRLGIPNITARLMCSDGVNLEPWDGQVVNISPTGVGVLSERRVAVGDSLLVEIRLPSGGTLNLCGRVVRHSEEGPSVVLGCRLAIAPAGVHLRELRKLAAMFSHE